MSGDLLLNIEDLVVEFPASGGRTVHAVSGVSLDIRRNETLGLVGESGCGKSSLARAIMQIPPPTSGRVLLDGVDLAAIRDSQLKEMRRHFQMIFQDPVSSLNPSRSVGESIAAPLLSLGGMDKTERTRRTREIMTAVGLDVERHYGRRPRQLSGGQCQRAGIARALITGPQLLVCDEPVSSLDVSVQAQILNLMRRLQDEMGLTYLFISHDMSVVRHMSDQIAVMYLGRIVEQAATEVLFAGPKHPYTQLLLDTIPNVADPRRDRVPQSGEVPSPMAPPSGCTFHPRCPQADARCSAERPEMQAYSDGSRVACHRVAEAMAALAVPSVGEHRLSA